jgi:hypothetical protein
VAVPLVVVVPCVARVIFTELRVCVCVCVCVCVMCRVDDSDTKEGKGGDSNVGMLPCPTSKEKRQTDSSSSVPPGGRAPGGCRALRGQSDLHRAVCVCVCYVSSR